MYAKINEKGYLELYEKRHIRIGKSLILNPRAEDMLKAGYKPLIIGTPPKTEDNEILKIDYRDNGEYIEEVYTVMEVI